RPDPGCSRYRGLFTLLQADGFELVLLHRGEGDVARRRHADLCAVGRMDREAGHAVDDAGLDISELLHSDEGEILGRHLAKLLGDRHVPLLSPPTGFLMPFPAGVLISIARTMPSAARRRRSIFKSPLSRAAPTTSMPSASTKLRWN